MRNRLPNPLPANVTNRVNASCSSSLSLIQSGGGGVPKGEATSLRETLARTVLGLFTQHIAVTLADSLACIISISIIYVYVIYTNI